MTARRTATPAAAAPGSLAAIAAPSSRSGSRCAIGSIEIGLVSFISEVFATLDRDGRAVGFGLGFKRTVRIRCRRGGASHLGSLFPEHRFARQLDAVAFQGKHFDQ